MLIWRTKVRSKEIYQPNLKKFNALTTMLIGFSMKSWKIVLKIQKDDSRES